MCEQVCIIAGGKKILDGALREVKRENRGTHFHVEFEEETEAVVRFMEDNPFGDAARSGEGWRVDLAPNADPAALMAAVAGLAAPVLRFEREQPSLHEIFALPIESIFDPNGATET
jgi:ABC-type uncharacterized transport system ATPase subunit